MTSLALTSRARQTRLVTVEPDLDVPVVDDDIDSAFFPCALREPFAGPTSAPPRERPATLLQLRLGLNLTAASRITTTDGVVYELLAPVAPLRAAHIGLGFQAPVMRLGDLYPLSATLEELGGADVATAVPLALYSPSERNSERGDFDSYLAECPVEYAERLREPNRQLTLGTRTFKITRAVVDYQTPRVELELRRG